MPYKIIRNDITKMHVECIVNTANPYPAIGDGCDSAIYHAAGSSELLAYRNALGKFEECDVFLTPGFHFQTFSSISVDFYIVSLL